MLEKFHIAYSRLHTLDIETILDTDRQAVQRANGVAFAL